MDLLEAYSERIYEQVEVVDDPYWVDSRTEVLYDKDDLIVSIGENQDLDLYTVMVEKSAHFYRPIDGSITGNLRKRFGARLMVTKELVLDKGWTGGTIAHYVEGAEIALNARIREVAREQAKEGWISEYGLT